MSPALMRIWHCQVLSPNTVASTVAASTVASKVRCNIAGKASATHVLHSGERGVNSIFIFVKGNGLQSIIARVLL